MPQQAARARRSWVRRPDHTLAPRTSALARLVAAFEVRCARIALALTIVPHGPAADRAERIAPGIGRGTSCHRRSGRRRLHVAFAILLPDPPVPPAVRAP